MAGGTWLYQNKVLPGFYLNVKSKQSELIKVGDRGVTLMPLVLSWGASKQVIRTEASTDFVPVTGYTIIDPETLVIREAIKRARYVDVYRLNTGVKATATAGSLKLDALYGGTRGNDIVVTVESNVANPVLWDVETVVDGFTADVQTVSDIEGLVSNDWVVFSKAGASATLEATAGTPLVGGTNGTVSNQDHVDFMAEAENRRFNTLALMDVSTSLKSIYTTFIKRVRETIGTYKSQLVLSNYRADYEGVINVAGGYTLTDGTVITADQAVAWVAGATAGASEIEALTYTTVEDAVDASPRLNRTDQETALKNGEFIFVFSNDKAKVLQDINSFTSVTIDKNARFRKNRVIRVNDGLANDTSATFEDSYIGKVDNDEDGRGLFRAAITRLVTIRVDIGAITDFNAQTDITVTEGDEADSVVVVLYYKPVDSVEKIYATFLVR